MSKYQGYIPAHLAVAVRWRERAPSIRYFPNLEPLNLSVATPPQEDRTACCAYDTSVICSYMFRHGIGGKGSRTVLKGPPYLSLVTVFPHTHTLAGVSSGSAVCRCCEAAMIACCTATVGDKT